MFDIGMTEMLMIAVVAIIVVGPKDLPGMLRTIGKYVGQIRAMAREFQGQMNSAIKEADLDGVQSTLKEVGNLHPVNQIKNEVSNLLDDADDDTSSAKKPQTAEAIDGGVPEPANDAVTKDPEKIPETVGQQEIASDTETAAKTVAEKTP